MNTPPTDVRIASKVAWEHVAKKAVRAIGARLVVFVIAYLALGRTVARMSLTSAGFVKVLTPTFPGNVAPAGLEVVASLDGKEWDGGLLSNAQATLLPQPATAVVRVEAGPYGEIKWSEAATVVDGEVLAHGLKSKPDSHLNNEYIVSCVEGSICSEGSTFIISADSIVGVKG